MDGELARVAAAQHGVFFRRQALDSGYSENEIAARVRRKEWVRLRRGAYARHALVEALSPAERHVLMVRAVVPKLDGEVVVAGYSALAVMKVPLWGVDLGDVHVHRGPTMTSRREAGVVHHLGPLSSNEVHEVDGLKITTPELSVVDACRISPFEAGVVMADGARRELRFDMDVALGVVERQRDWAGSVTASRVLRFSDPLAATVGESRGRVMLARIGLPRPELQKEIRNRHGVLLGTTDFYLEEHDTVAEFDGKVKYGRELYERTGRLEHVDVGEIVWREKRREDAIRDEGHEMVRFVWSELDGSDASIRARFLRAFARAQRRRAN